jgi:hypothetical protein
MDAAENSSWDLANKMEIFGLENWLKNSRQINNDDLCLPIYLLFSPRTNMLHCLVISALDEKCAFEIILEECVSLILFPFYIEHVK